MTPQASDPQYLAPVALLRSTRSRGSRRQSAVRRRFKAEQTDGRSTVLIQGAHCRASKDARWPSARPSRAASRAQGGTRARRRRLEMTLQKLENIEIRAWTCYGPGSFGPPISGAGRTPDREPSGAVGAYDLGRLRGTMFEAPELQILPPN